MAHQSTVIRQLLKLIPRHEFQAAAHRHHVGQRLRAVSRWDQFVALATAQLAGQASLRDLEAGLLAQQHKLYHLGARPVSRSSLARINRDQPASLFEEVFQKLLARAQRRAPKHPFHFPGKLFSIDATFIEVTASLFPWAHFRQTKGALKLHIGLDHDGFLPRFVQMTDGQSYDGAWPKELDLPKASVVVFDRGYVDYKLFKHLDQRKIRFVTRHRRDIQFTVLKRHQVDAHSGLTCDQIVRLQGKSRLVVRRVGYRDPETKKHLVFLTNALELAPETVAQIYRERWKIELFFKWIKQNLKLRTFLGTSPNAVLSQIWVALIVYLLLSLIKFEAQLAWPLMRILRILRTNLFERRDLLALLQPTRRPPPEPRRQLLLEGI